MLRWTSWAPVPNKPRVLVDEKQNFNQLHKLQLLFFKLLGLVHFSHFLHYKDFLFCFLNGSIMRLTNIKCRQGVHVMLTLLLSNLCTLLTWGRIILMVLSNRADIHSAKYGQLTVGTL